MAWKHRKKMWKWEDFLTTAERDLVQEADAENAKIEKLRAAWDKKYGRQRKLIVNRAIHRAKYETVRHGNKQVLDQVSQSKGRA